MLASGASGSGGSAGKNYISSYNGNPCNGDFETGSISGWSVFSVSSITNGLPSGAPSIIANPTVGTDPVVSLLSPGSQLAGQYSLQASFPISTSVNKGFISDIFTIDSGDKAKVLTFKFYYQLTSAAANANFSGTSSNTLLVSVYAVDGSNIGWVQPAGVYSMTQSSGAGIATGTFQTYSDATQYRFAIICANNPTSTAATVTFDDFSVGPLTAPIGAPVNDWVDKGTMTIGAVTTAPSKGTIAIDKIFMRRVGDSAQFLYEYSQTTAGGAGSGTYLFSLPSGMSIDTSKITVAGGGSIRSGNSAVGFGAASVNSSTGINANITVYPYSATQIFLFVTSSQNTSGTGDGSVDESISSTSFQLSDSVASYKFTFTVPIAGWSSNVQTSDSTDTRVVVARAQRTTTQSLSNSTATKVQFDLVNEDTNGSFDATTNYRYTIPVSGRYIISGSLACLFSANNGVLFASLYVDGSSVDVRGLNHTTNATNANAYINFSFERNLNAGQYVEIFATQTNSGAGSLNLRGNDLVTGASSFIITRLSGPSVIAATETVAASYWSTSAPVINAPNPFQFDGKEYDTHNAVTTGASWKFTAPISGKYSVKAFMNPSVTPAGAIYFYLFKNSSNYATIGWQAATNANSVGYTINLNAGDNIFLSPNIQYTMTGNAVRSTAGVCSIQIERVGN